MKKKKVLFILHYSPPVHGASKVGDSILNSNIIKDAYNSKFIKIKSSQNLNEIGKFSLFKLYYLIELFFKISISLLLFRPKVIYYTMSPSGFAFFRDVIMQLPIKVYAFFTKTKIYFHYHARGINNFVSDSKLKLSLTNFVTSKVYLIFISELLKTDIKKLNRYKDVFFIPNGVENTLTNKEFNNILESRTSNTQIRILYLSNMIKEKGYDVVLQIAKQLKNLNNHNIKIDFAGGWSSEEDQLFFKSYVEEHKLNDIIHYHGLVLGKQKKELFSNSSLFIFPSSYRHEVFPLSILEALSYGLPILSFRIGATPEIINNKIGILTNKDFIFDDLNKMIENYQNKTVYQRCRNEFLNHYTVEMFEKNLVKILR